MAQIIIAAAGDFWVQPQSMGIDELLSILPLALVPVLVAVSIYFILKSAGAKKPARPRRDWGDEAGYQPLIFQTPQRWLAIQRATPRAVQMALGLHHAEPCSWEEGCFIGRDPKLFISPPVLGWVLVFGSDLPDPAQDVDACFHFIRSLSLKLGRVQCFSANRITGAHAWVQADWGRIVRAYAWCGRTLWNQGRSTADEAALGLKCFDYAEAEESCFPPPESHQANAEKVAHLAARWSVDPTAINASMIHDAPGIAGELGHFKPKGNC